MSELIVPFPYWKKDAIEASRDQPLRRAIRYRPYPRLPTFLAVCLILSATIALCRQDASSGLDQRLEIGVNLENADAREALSFVCKAAELEIWRFPADRKATLTAYLLMPTFRKELYAITQPAGFAYAINAGKLKVARR